MVSEGTIIIFAEKTSRNLIGARDPGMFFMAVVQSLRQSFRPDLISRLQRAVMSVP